MDDFILFGEETHILKEQLAGVRRFIEGWLQLELKAHAIMLAPVAQGIPFLGFRVFPRLIRLDGRKWSRFRCTVRQREAQYLRGEIDEEELARRVSAMIGHVQHANTRNARRAFFAESLYLG